MGATKPVENGATPKETVSVFDQLADSYDDLFRSPWEQAEDRFVGAALRRSLVDRGTREVLDVGCGTGGALALVPEYRGHYMGIDASHEMLRVARKRWANRRLTEFRAQSFEERLPREWAAIVGLYSVSYGLPPHDLSWRLRHLAGHLGRQGVMVLTLYAPAHKHLRHPTCPHERAVDVDQCHEAFSGSGRDVRVSPYSSNFGVALAQRLPRWAIPIAFTLDRWLLCLRPGRARYFLVEVSECRV